MDLPFLSINRDRQNEQEPLQVGSVLINGKKLRYRMDHDSNNAGATPPKLSVLAMKDEGEI
jgi:hypothetical protein